EKDEGGPEDQQAEPLQGGGGEGAPGGTPALPLAQRGSLALAGTHEAGSIDQTRAGYAREEFRLRRSLRPHPRKTSSRPLKRSPSRAPRRGGPPARPARGRRLSA